MKVRPIAIGGVVVVLGIVSIALFWRGDDRPTNEAPRPTVPSTPAGSPAEGHPTSVVVPSGQRESQPSPSSIEEAEAAVQRARDDHRAALAVFEDAKDKLADIEHELAAVEGFIEDIKARGEDPTDFAFEGVERLNPVIDRFDERVAGVEAAEQRSNETARVLRSAEQVLDSIRIN